MGPKKAATTPKKASLVGSNAAVNSMKVSGVARRGVASRVQKEGFASQSLVQSLQDEIALLTSYALDTVYRLRYDTMQYDYINQNIEKLLGFSVDEIRKINIRSLILETRIVTNGLRTVDSFEELEECREKGDVNKWQADYLMRTKSGDKVWISDVSYPWFDDHGKIIGSVGSLRDITDRVQAEEQIRLELQRAQELDMLTGTSNRTGFFNELERELRRIHRTDSTVAIMLFSINNFFDIQQKFGNEVADNILKQFTAVSQDAMRVTDTLARIGGEEFAMLLPETTSQGAHMVADRLNKSVLKHVFESGADHAQPVHITISAGVASTSSINCLTSSELFKLADTRLYIARNSGDETPICMDQVRQTH